MHDRGYKTYLDQQPPATLACHAWILVSSAPGSLGIPGAERRSVPFLPKQLGKNTYVPCEPKKIEKNRETRTRPLS